MKIMILAAAVALSACAPVRPANYRAPTADELTVPYDTSVPMRTSFNGDAHRAYTVKGKNRVTGQGFLRQQGGGTVTCAGEAVRLIPRTPFFEELITIAKQGKTPRFVGEKPGPEFAALNRTAQCDAQGNFEFDEVPAGQYVLGTTVQWSVGNRRQGGDIAKSIEVKDGQVNKFLLSDADRT